MLESVLFFMAWQPDDALRFSKRLSLPRNNFQDRFHEQERLLPNGMAVICAYQAAIKCMAAAQKPSLFESDRPFWSWSDVFATAYKNCLIE